MEGRIDDELRSELSELIGSGEVVLFTGAGCSRDAPSLAGTPVPSSAELVDPRWDVAFPSAQQDDSELEDVSGTSTWPTTCGSARGALADYEAWGSGSPTSATTVRVTRSGVRSR